ncbi:MAG: T9SS type A sorting domain-containing protein [Flammeovirgaceae bacterium]
MKQNYYLILYAFMACMFWDIGHVTAQTKIRNVETGSEYSRPDNGNLWSGRKLVIVEPYNCGNYKVKSGTNFLTANAGIQMAAGPINPLQLRPAENNCGGTVANFFGVRFKDPGQSYWTFILRKATIIVGPQPFYTKITHEGGLVTWTVYQRRLGQDNDDAIYQKRISDITQEPITEFIYPTAWCRGQWHRFENDQITLNDETTYHCDTWSHVGYEEGDPNRGYSYRIRTCSSGRGCDNFNTPIIRLKDLTINGSAQGSIGGDDAPAGASVEVEGGLVVVFPKGRCVNIASATRTINACANARIAQHDHGQGGIQHYEIEKRMYPNPVENILNLEFTLEKEALVSIKIFNQQGQLVKEVKKEESMLGGPYKLSVSAQDWQQGVYIVMMDLGEEGVLTKRIVKL